ncbi:MAG: CDP-glycerol glycerophosphotransferase family protein [Eubacterium sp.]|nr:CDP-glycerol glycerophosphotransferase family protein [Eubacterium sp.]
MSIKTVIKEISITDHNLNISLEVECDHYRVGQRAPRIEIVFDNGEDDRRMNIPADSFGPGKEEKTATAYAACSFYMENIFWNCVWKNCSCHIDIEYDGVTYEKVPLFSEACDAGRKNVLSFKGDHYSIHFPEEIDARRQKPVGLIQTILAILLHVGTALLGILLLPWFCIDVLGMLLLNTERVEGNVPGSFLKRYIFYVSWRYFGFGRNKEGVAGMKINFLMLTYQLVSALHRKKRGLLFLSTRRRDLTGNFEYIYDYIKNDPGIRTSFWLHPEEIRHASMGSLLDLAVKAGRARVILVDDFVFFLEYMGISPDTDVMQLWHACGAFKTFGFSRTGKRGGPNQLTLTHRGYDYCFVSSSSIAKYYAEGFGLAEKKVLPYGVPRTDMFFDEEVRRQKKADLYQNYPELENKKVILFAPTFRGDGKQSAYYEAKRFDPNALMDGLPEDTVLIVKHHPFVKLTYKIADRHKNRIFNFSGKSEINDLLFITDLLITD